MRTLAVILAAIAALAATTQAYMIWEEWGQYNRKTIHEKRVLICEAFVTSLREAQRMEPVIDSVLEEVGDLNSLDQEALTQAARDMFSVDTYFVLSGLMVPEVYFSDEEFAQLGVTEVRKLSNKSISSTYYISTATADQVNEVINLVREAAAHYDTALTLCEPIMLGKSH